MGNFLEVMTINWLFLKVLVGSFGATLNGLISVGHIIFQHMLNFYWKICMGHINVFLEK